MQLKCTAACDVDCTLALQLFVQGMSRQGTSAACAEDVNLSRKFAVVLSLPVSESASVVDGSGTASSFWPPKSFTDSGLLLLITVTRNTYMLHHDLAVLIHMDNTNSSVHAFQLTMVYIRAAYRCTPYIAAWDHRLQSVVCNHVNNFARRDKPDLS